MFIGLIQKAKHLQFLLNDNSPAILTGLGVSGTVATAYLTGRASFKAADIIKQDERLFDVKEEHGTYVGVESPQINRQSTMHRVGLVWRLYLPPVAVGLTTVTSIVMANRISSNKIIALTMASGISERALQEYKDKIVEKLGDRQSRDLREEIAQDRVDKNPVNSREIILAGTGEVLCYDMSSGRYFQSTIEEIKRAENRVNKDLIHFMSASLSMFYEEIGLSPTSYSDTVGWNMNNSIEVTFSTTMSTDGRPCIAVDFVRQPITDYDRTAWQ